MSSTKQILQLAYEVRISAINSIENVTTLLRKCLTICQMLKRDVEWIKLELYGYGDKWKTMEEALENAPIYRQTHLLYKDFYGKPVLIEDKLSFVTKYAIVNSISQIESEKYSGLTIVGGITDFLREQCKKPIYSASISAFALNGILDAVRNRALEFANDIILELEYGNILSSIFEENRKFVDSRLVEICPSAIEKLTTTYCDIVGGSSSLDWSQIAFACRDILQDFTESIYKPDYLPKGEEPPTRAQTIKKLALTLQARVAKTEDTERKLIVAQIDYLLNYFTELNNLIQKHTHPEKYKVKKEDAHKCVMYTYLVIGDILRILS
jgi:hypothetical protein